MLKKILISTLVMMLVIAGVVAIVPFGQEVVDEGDINSVTAYDMDGVAQVALGNEPRYVYLGGKPLGIDVKSNGLIITGVQDVVTKDGIVSPCEDIGIENGDILFAIDGNRMLSEKDVLDATLGKDSVTLTLDKNGNKSDHVVNTAIDVVSGREKLGLWLKDGIQGIGTLTYIDPSSRRYGALGHPIEANKVYRSGRLYDANIYGYVKGEKGKAGELSGDIIAGKPIGTIDKNTDYGIFGTYLAKVDDMERIEVAHRSEIRPGKAYIYTTINGETPRKYDIEIIKRASQLKPETKGMVIRITDSELLDKTNGILQGMSGSPIIQNGKLVGAVTHVFINDPMKGYGVYVDFMLDN